MSKQETKQELKSCPVAAALAPVRQLKKGEQVSALIFEGGGTKGAAYAGVVKALDAAGLVMRSRPWRRAAARPWSATSSTTYPPRCRCRRGTPTTRCCFGRNLGSCSHACQLPTPRRRDESHKTPPLLLQ